MHFFASCDNETAHKSLMAFLLADSYFEAGLRGYQQFAGLYSPDPSSKGGLGHKITGTEHYALFSAGMLLAFSIELYVKSMAGQRGLEVPWGHKIKEELIPSLSSEMVQDLRQRFDATKGQENLLAVDLNPATESEHEKRSGQDSFDDAITQVSRLFIDLRYVHEHLTAPKVRRIDFSNLIRIARAIRGSITDFRGPKVVTHTGK